MPSTLQRLVNDAIAYLAALNSRERALLSLLLCVTLAYGAVRVFDLQEEALSNFSR